jgi:hypothetical protein
MALVYFHILWVCGWLAFLGLEVPFAKADDFKRLNAAVQISAKLNIAREIRDQVQARCSTRDYNTRRAFDSAIETLQLEYMTVTGGQRYPEPPCQ